jgi:ABC-2 type transport system ATP-binding protein
MENIVEVRNVDKVFSGFALKNVNFDIKKGFITGFIGPNGAGKTTVIRCLMNLLHIDNGSIHIFGKTHQQDTEAIKQNIGFVYDGDYFYRDLSIEQHKRIIAPFYKKWDDQLFYSYMKYFNLPLNKKIKHLSRGMKLKFSIAVALSHNPQLLIMDEPTSGLDPVFRRELMDLLQDIMQDENKSIFFSTHITADLEKVADYVTFIHNGEIVISKEKDEVLREYVLVKGPNHALSSSLRARLQGLKVTDVGFEGLIKNDNTLPDHLESELLLEQPTLEDIIFYTVKEDKHAVKSDA